MTTADIIGACLKAHDMDPSTLIAFRRLQPIDGESFIVALSRDAESFYVTTLDAVAGTMADPTTVYDRPTATYTAQALDERMLLY